MWISWVHANICSIRYIERRTLSLTVWIVLWLPSSCQYIGWAFHLTWFKEFEFRWILVHGGDINSRRGFEINYTSKELIIIIKTIDIKNRRTRLWLTIWINVRQDDVKFNTDLKVIEIDGCIHPPVKWINMGLSTIIKHIFTLISVHADPATRLLWCECAPCPPLRKKLTWFETCY